MALTNKIPLLVSRGVNPQEAARNLREARPANRRTRPDLKRRGIEPKRRFVEEVTDDVEVRWLGHGLDACCDKQNMDGLISTTGSSDGTGAVSNILACQTKFEPDIKARY